MAKTASKSSVDELLDEVFHDEKAKYGLSFFKKGERSRLHLQRDEQGRVEIFCAKRAKWLRAKPEEGNPSAS